MCVFLLGELWLFLKVAARDRTEPQSDASRSAAWSFDGEAILLMRRPIRPAIRKPREHFVQCVSRSLVFLRNRVTLMAGCADPKSAASHEPHGHR